MFLRCILFSRFLLSLCVPSLVYRRDRRADSRKSPIDNPAEEKNDPAVPVSAAWRAPGILGVYARNALKHCGHESAVAGLNLDALPLSTREFLRTGIKAAAKKLSIYCARGVDTR